MNSDEIPPKEGDNFYAVTSILECSFDNLYGCGENVLLEILALFSFLYGTIALKNIFKDRNQILDWLDKLIVFIAYLQFIMLVLFFGAFSGSLYQYSIRSLFFTNSILICLTVITIHEMSGETKRNVVKIIKFSFLYMFSLWFFCGYLHQNNEGTPPYSCTHVDWVLISGSTLLLGFIQSYVTLSIIQSIQNYTKPDIGYPEEGIQNYSKDDGENRKVQLTSLMIGMVVPSFIQFLWDYIAHTHADTLQECNEYFFASTFFTLIIFLANKFLCFFLAPWSIFFVFYWKNRKYINTIQDNPNDQIFFDRRSDLIDKYSL